MKKRYLAGLCLALVSTLGSVGCGDDTVDSVSDLDSGAGGDDSSAEPSDTDDDTATTESETTESTTEQPTSADSESSEVSSTSSDTDASTATDVGTATAPAGSDAGSGESETSNTETATGDDTATLGTSEATDAPTSSLDSGLDGGPSGVTYYQDVLPVFEQNCVQCHQPGGIGPFDLTDFEAASAWAGPIQEETAARTMPPNLVLNDGSCGDFTSAWLSEEQIALIAAWTQGGALEGEPRDAVVAELPILTNSVDILTPEFSPVAGGGVLDLNDEYRCFLSDFSTEAELEFITGFNVIPGNDKLVHHVLGFIVDTDADSEVDGVTNGELIATMDGDSPEREGWPCFGMAGDGIAVESSPVSWAPGQGVVTYPDESGVVITPNRRLVFQVHYNLADPAVVGQSDETTVQLQVKPPDEVENVGVFLLKDPLLGSLGEAVPETIAPGEESVLYTWERTFEELGLPSILPAFNLYGVSPHMHELGHRYTFEVLPADADDAPVCATQVDEWDFHWQHTYFYKEPMVLTPADSVRVTCDYDTSSKTEPVLPGWGTRNEMCLGNFYVTLPKILLGL